MLDARAHTSAREAIERLVALQAQVARPPFVGLWTRLADFRREELLALLRDRLVVRSTAMRATLHLMSAADFVRFRGALQPALARGMQSVLHSVFTRLDLPELERQARAFFGAAPATFDALRKHLAANADGLERAMAYAIRTHVPLVQVPTDDVWGFPASADFALADQWLEVDVSAASSPAHDLVRRYLGAFGPASPRDAQVWSGLPGLREVFDELRPELLTFRDERKRELFDLPDAPRPDAESPVPVRFVPEYDNLLLSHYDRARVIAEEHRSRIVSKNLQVRATFLMDGFVAGACKVERTRAGAALVIEPFGKLTRKTKSELEAEGHAMLRFIEPDATKGDIRYTMP